MTISGSSWNTFHEFCLNCETERVANVVARYELFRMTSHLPGDIVECGVYRGAGVGLWAKLIEMFSPLAMKRVVGFDTFSGYGNDLGVDHDAKNAKRLMTKDRHFSQTTAASIQETLEELSVGKRIELISGDAVETIPEYVKRNPGFRVSLLNLDFDVYEPTKVALNSLFRLVVPGGVIILDEYGVRGWGESDAVDEFFSGYEGIIINSFGWTRTPTAFVIKGAYPSPP